MVTGIDQILRGEHRARAAGGVSSLHWAGRDPLRPVTPALPQPTFEAEAPCRKYLNRQSVKGP